MEIKTVEQGQSQIVDSVVNEEWVAGYDGEESEGF